MDRKSTDGNFDELYTSFIPYHILKRFENQVILKRYKEILHRGRFPKIHFKVISDLKDQNIDASNKMNDHHASMKLFKEIAKLRVFDAYGNTLRGRKLSKNSGDKEVIVRKSILMQKSTNNP